MLLAHNDCKNGLNGFPKINLVVAQQDNGIVLHILNAFFFSHGSFCGRLIFGRCGVGLQFFFGYMHNGILFKKIVSIIGGGDGITFGLVGNLFPSPRAPLPRERGERNIYRYPDERPGYMAKGMI
jgi:hypothetical protein